MRDRRGLEVHGAAAAIDAYDRALDHLLRFQVEMVPAGIEAVSADPGFALGHVFNCYIALLSTDATATAEARERFLDARFDEAALDGRERGHVAIARRWLDGDLLGASEALASLTIEHPRDLLALAVGHQIDFFTGNAPSLRDRIGRALDAWHPDDPDHGFLLGMYAFGLEETNLYGRSEDLGLRAAAANVDDVWAIHAVVHTFEMQSRIPEGITFMRAREASWAEGNFLSVHNAWHYALFALQGGEVAPALEIYDQVLHPEGAEDIPLHLLDASSLLWRLHLDGLPTGDRWSSLADAWARCLTPGRSPFNDLHAAMAYVGAGKQDALDELLDELARVAAHPSATDTGALLTSSVGLAVCRALRAYGDARYELVVTELLAVRRSLHTIGGSHAQRDVVERTLLLCAVEAGDHALAGALLSERLARNEASTWSWLAKARARHAAGDEGEAAASQQRSHELSMPIREALVAS
jgi:hypothetical protein